MNRLISELAPFSSRIPTATPWNSCSAIGGSPQRSSENWERYGLRQAVTLAPGGRQARFSDKSHLDRIREERVTPLVQGPHEIRLDVDCSTFAIAPFSSVGIERKVL